MRKARPVQNAMGAKASRNTCLKLLCRGLVLQGLSEPPRDGSVRRLLLGDVGRDVLCHLAAAEKDCTHDDCACNDLRDTNGLAEQQQAD